MVTDYVSSDAGREFGQRHKESGCVNCGGETFETSNGLGTGFECDECGMFIMYNSVKDNVFIRCDESSLPEKFNWEKLDG